MLGHILHAWGKRMTSSVLKKNKRVKPKSVCIYGMGHYVGNTIAVQKIAGSLDNNCFNAVCNCILYVRTCH